MTIGEAYKQLFFALVAIYNPREANNIANLVIEHITGFSNSNRIIHKQDSLTHGQEETLQKITAQLITHKPVQYVLHEAFFYNLALYVDEHVLIPRPETEELVDWLIKEVKKVSRYKIQDVRSKMYDVRCTMLDVGTGSGCIAIAVKNNLPQINMYAADVSEEALSVAKNNAATHKTKIQFVEMNVLDEHQWKALPALDYIVSNPPYVAQSEARFMNDNVLAFEPHGALFVPDNNPLLFYEAISAIGLKYLKKEGKLFFEINEVFGDEVTELLVNKGYKNIELKKDLQGKNRMIKAERNW